jgi:methylenetetrahydrofolate dehydrogenase (NADP+)/methenyltetrahydrofolate cyclohydrolase
MIKIIDGVLLAKTINKNTKNKVATLKNGNINPHLAVILIGDNPESHLYVSIKEKKCKKLNIEFSKYLIPSSAEEKEIIYLIQSLNKDKNITSIVLQLPIDKKYNTEKIISHIDPRKDVDGLGANSLFTAPTALAILEIIKSYKIKIKNKKIVLIGYGRLVGKPLEKLLRKKYPQINLSICTSKTKNIKHITETADLIISAVGKPHLIKANMIKKGVVIIDAGTSTQNAQIKKTTNQKQSQTIGDVDFDDVKSLCSYITPPKGGVGPITVAKLLENTANFNNQS